MTETAVILCLGDRGTLIASGGLWMGYLPLARVVDPLPCSWVFGTTISPPVSKIRLLPTLRPPAQPIIIGDEADVTSQGWIPLIGVQVAYEGAASKLAVRAVGFPTTLGSVKYSETIRSLTGSKQQAHIMAAAFWKFSLNIPESSVERMSGFSAGGTICMGVRI